MKKYIIIMILLVSNLLLASLRVVSYNALNFGGNDVDRLEYLVTILEEIEADVILLQEIEDAAGMQMLLSALNDSGTIYSGSEYINGPDTNNFLIYKNDSIIYASQDTIATDLRDIAEFEIIADGNLLRFYSCHLKASQGNEEERLAEVTKLREHLSQLDAGSEFIIVGDMNFYTSSEPGYQKFIADEGSNIGRAEDLTDLVGNWHNNADYVEVHTQSTRTTAFGGGASGGLDDRFDFILSSFNLNNNSGLEYIEESLVSFGNDSNHFNQSINDGTNSVVSSDVADALYFASDHLPVYADFDVIESLDPILVLTTPNMEEEWQQGVNYEIKWVSYNFNDNIKIELEMTESTNREILVSSTENDGIWEWQIPEDLELGAYNIIISNASGEEPSDISNNPFSIIEMTQDYTIYEIQYSLTGPSQLEEMQVITSGIVTAVYNYGYFIQDDYGAWNGVFVYEYGSNFDLGDEINITATVAEYFDKTELIDIVEYNLLSSGNPLPGAVLLTTETVNQENYEGVLVRVQNAECTSYDPEYGEWIVNDGSGNLIVNDLLFAFTPTIGELYNITGIVDYSYGAFKIEPRSGNDISDPSSAQNEVVINNCLLSNHPNPFNPETTFSFYLTAKDAKNAKIEIYNLKGQKIDQLQITNCELGINEVTWNAESFVSGIYFYKLIIDDKVTTSKKCILLK